MSWLDKEEDYVDYESDQGVDSCPKQEQNEVS